MRRIIVVGMLLLVLLPVAVADTGFHRTRRIPIVVPSSSNTYIDCVIGIGVGEPDYSLRKMTLHSLGVGVVATSDSLENESFLILINATFAGVEIDVDARIDSFISFSIIAESTYYPILPLPPTSTEYQWVIPAKITFVGNESLSGNVTIEVLYDYTLYIGSDAISPQPSGSPLFMIVLVLAIVIPIAIVIRLYERWRFE